MSREGGLRVLGILGSPRPGGNSELLLDRVLAGAESAEALAEKVSLRDLRIEPCYECRGCREGAECVRKDDMQLLHPKLASAPRLVIATPIFFMGVPAMAKMMIDRAQPFWVGKYVLRKPLPPLPEGRKGFLLAVAARRSDRVFEAARLEVKAFFHVLDMDYGGELLIPGLEDKGAVNFHPTALADAFAFGKKIAE